MTPSVVTLQEVLRHHRTLSRRGREFYESLLAHGDVLAVRLDYLPGAMMWLVTTPNQLSLLSRATLLARGEHNAFRDGSYPAHMIHAKDFAVWSR